MKSLFLIVFILATADAWSRTMADTYSLSPVMPAGKYQGQKINTTVKRPVAIMNGTPVQKAFGLDERHWLIANIYHNRRFYIAAVPKTSVKQVLFLTEPFMGFLSHSMLRFQFSEPVKLIAEVPSLTEVSWGVTHKPLEVPIELNDLLMSVEATSPHGVEEFSTVESFFNTRGLVYRFMSLTGLGVSKLISGKATINQHPLRLSTREASRVLRDALYTSDYAGTSKMYNTLFGNCNKYCAEILEKSRRLTERESTAIGRLVATIQAMASNFMVFAKFNPPAQRLLASHETINMEQEPEFLRLAAGYPRNAACEEHLAATGIE